MKSDKPAVIDLKFRRNISHTRRKEILGVAYEFRQADFLATYGLPFQQLHAACPDHRTAVQMSMEDRAVLQMDQAAPQTDNCS
jgi:hypothetical protein